MPYLKSTPVSILLPALVKTKPALGTPSMVKVEPANPGTPADKLSLDRKLELSTNLHKVSQCPETGEVLLLVESTSCSYTIKNLSSLGTMKLREGSMTAPLIILCLPAHLCSTLPSAWLTMSQLGLMKSKLEFLSSPVLITVLLYSVDT